MTNADVPLIALNGLIGNPINPNTALPLHFDKAKGVEITTIGALCTYRQTKYVYNICSNQWLHVKENIFDPVNWTSICK